MRRRLWAPLAAIMAGALLLTLAAGMSGWFNGPPLTDHQKDFRDFMSCYEKPSPCP